ncbi:MAG: hypothetical protein GY701_05575, partial [Sulfitobacter sp.]|nr:hypothetical protein [Sulfitobacter sp.]
MSADLTGGAGSDTFNIDNALTGSVDGGVGGTDTLQGTALSNAILTGSAATNEFAGTITGVSGGFSGIDTLNGSGTLSGQDADANWSSSAANNGSYVTGGNTLTYTGFSSWIGGSLADNFTLAHDVATVNGGNGSNSYNVNSSITSNLTGGTGTDSFVIADTVELTGTIDGGANSDTLDMGSYTTLLNLDLNAVAANGISGTTSGTPNPVSGGFSNIDIFIGSSSDNVFNVNTV